MILYNPAGLAEAGQLRLAFAYHSALNFRQGFFAGAFPLKPVGAIGVSIKYFSFDEQEIIGPSGPEEVLGRFTPHANEFRLTLARSLGERIMVGVSLGVYDVRIAPAGLFGTV